MYYAKKVLEDYGFTQKKLAKKLDVSEMSIHAYVNGNPTMKSIRRMADALGADVLEFFTPLHKDDNLLRSMILARKEAEIIEANKLCR